MFTLKGWERYNNGTPPVFTTRRAAERAAASLRQLRAWVEVVEVENVETAE